MNTYEDFDWESTPVEREYDARFCGGTVLKMADGYAPEVRVDVPHFSALAGSVELDG